MSDMWFYDNPLKRLFGSGAFFAGLREREESVLAKVTRWEPMVTREERVKLVEDRVRLGGVSRAEAWQYAHRQTCRMSHRLKYPATVRMLAEMEARMEFLGWLRGVE